MVVIGMKHYTTVGGITKVKQPLNDLSCTIYHMQSHLPQPWRGTYHDILICNYIIVILANAHPNAANMANKYTCSIIM